MDDRAPSSALRELVAACLERFDAEGDAAVEAICRDHPEHAAPLRRRIGRLRQLGLVGATARPSSTPRQLGDFRLLEQLGEGGMGVVHLAEQVSLKRQVALKVVRPELGHSKLARERFHREIEAIARLHHPGIVTIHAVGEEGGIPYFAMELVAGTTLAHALAELKERTPDRLSGRDLAAAIRARTPGAADSNGTSWLFEGSWTDTCLRIARQVAEALEHAHRRGVLHRDVKPSNLMLTPTGRVLLLDFGLAAAEGNERITRSQTWLGSLPYSAPEQLRGDSVSVDARTDVYALGVTLYEMLTLALPHEADSVDRLARAIETGKTTSPRRRNPEVSWDAETVCLTAMEAARERRYASAADFARDLANVLQRRPIEARRPGVLLRTRRWGQRHPAKAVAATLLLLAVIGGPLLWGFVERDKKRSMQQAFARESELRKATEEMKERGDGLRLSALSSGLVESDPTLSLLLAIEGAERTPGPLANDALLRSLDACREIACLSDPESECTQVRFSPDGALLAAAGSKGVVRLWSVSELREVRSLYGHDDQVVAVAFSPDGERIVTASTDWTARIYRVADGVELAILRGHRSPLRGALWTGTRVVTWAADGSARVWDADRGSPAHVLGHEIEGKPAGIVDASASRDGRWLAVATDRGAAVVFDLEDGGTRRELGGHSKTLSTVRFDPRGERVVTAGLDDTARVFDLESGACLHVLGGHQAGVNAAEFSPDGDRIATVSRDHTLRMWGREQGKLPLWVASAGWKWLTALAFSSDGRQIAVGGLDEAVRLFAVADGKPIATFAAGDGNVRSLAFDPGGTRLASASRDAHVWRAAGPSELEGWEGHQDLVVIARLVQGGTRWLTTSHDGTAALWDAATRRRLATYRHDSSYAGRVEMSLDGTLVATSGVDGRLRVFAAGSGERLASLETDESSRRVVALAGDGRRVATDAPKYGLCVWDWQQSKRLAEIPAGTKGHDDALTAMEFDRAGERIATASRDRTAIVWDARTLRRLKVLGGRGAVPDENLGHTDYLTFVAWSPDGSSLVTCSQDFTARIWDAESGACRAVLTGHEASIVMASWSPDSRYVATASHDGCAKVWDAGSGARLMTLPGFEEIVHGVAFSDDGSQVTTLTATGLVRRFPFDPLAEARSRRPRTLRAEERRRHEVEDPGVWDEAERIVARLAAESVLAAELVGRVESEPGLAPSARAAALSLARAERDSPQLLSRRAWWVTRAPGATPEAAALALRRAQAGVALAPTGSDFVRGLAVARLRCGDAAGALELLQREDVLSERADQGEHVASLSYTAVALFRLGRVAEARRVLAQALALKGSFEGSTLYWADWFLREPIGLLGADPASNQEEH